MRCVVEATKVPWWSEEMSRSAYIRVSASARLPTYMLRTRDWKLILIHIGSQASSIENECLARIRCPTTILPQYILKLNQSRVTLNTAKLSSCFESATGRRLQYARWYALPKVSTLWRRFHPSNMGSTWRTWPCLDRSWLVHIKIRSDTSFNHRLQTKPWWSTKLAYPEGHPLRPPQID